MNIDITNLTQWLEAIQTLFGIITSIVAASKAFTGLVRRLRRRPVGRRRRTKRRTRR